MPQATKRKWTSTAGAAASTASGSSNKRAASVPKQQFKYRATFKQQQKKKPKGTSKRTHLQSIQLYSPFGKDRPPPSATAQGNFVCINDTCVWNFLSPLVAKQS
jgi:hypothetical protein